MFDKLKSLVAKAPREPRPPRENPNFITAPQRIVSLLNDLTYQRIVVYIALPGEEQNVDAEDLPNTFFKQVGTERAALERLQDEELHAKVLAAEQFKLVTDLYGAPLTFQTKVLKTQMLGEDEFYIIDLPTKVFYPESPEFRKFRVSVFKKFNVYVKQVGQEKGATGIIDTLSQTAMGILLIGEDSPLPHIRKGEKLMCTLIIDSQNLKCELVVENVKRLPDDKSIRVECRFGTMDKATTRTVASIMAETEQFFRNRVRKD